MLFCLLVAGLLFAAPYTRARVGWVDVAGLLERAELYTLDQRFLIRGPRRPLPEIAIIAIDELSLRELGAWPWPRTLHARLIDDLRQAGAAAVAFDVVFDRPAPPTPQGDPDKALADALKRSGRVVLACQYEPTTSGGNPAEQAARKVTHVEEEAHLDEAFAALRIVGGKMPKLPAAAPEWLGRATIDTFWSLPRPQFARHTTTGFINIRPDADAIYRRVRLVSPVNDGHLYPHLSLAVVARAMGIDLRKLQVLGGGVRLGEKLMIPIEQDGTLRIDFAGPPTVFPRYSFATVLRMTPAERREEFREKILFVGATAPGLFDIRASPYAKGDGGGDDTNLGVYTLANVTDAIMQRRFFERPGPLVTAGILLLIALYLGRALAVYPMWEAVGAATLLFVAYGLVGVMLFQERQVIVPMAAPLLSILLNVGVCMTYRFRVEYNERKRHRDYLDRYVSPQVAAHLVNHPEAAKVGKGERREITVLFSDIRGFTPISERLAPEEVTAMLCGYFTEMVRVVDRYEGMVNNFVGDALVAVYNVLTEQPDHARRAVLTALEMQRAFVRLQQQWEAAGQPQFRIGIGINTGPAFAGNIGMEKRMQYTVIGDTVNAAARFEALNKELGTTLLIGQATYERVADLVEARALPPVRVKGKSEPQQVYEVLGPKEPVPEPVALPTPVRPRLQLAFFRRRRPV